MFKCDRQKGDIEDFLVHYVLMYITTRFFGIITKFLYENLLDDSISYGVELEET